MASTDRFGYEWQRYSEMNPDHEGQFRGWVHPLTARDIAGKKVLDAGCGMGRNSYWMLRWGARELVAFDADVRSVASARRTLQHFANASVQQQDIYAIPWHDEFDIVFSIGVIHHLREPRTAIRKLVYALKKDGTLVIWVYSREGNEWIIRWINPIRTHITSRLPIALTYLLTYAFSVPLWLFVRIARGPTDYLAHVSRFSFHHLHGIVFDQLLPEVANYWSRTEVRALVDGLPLKDIRVVRSPHGAGWTLIAQKI